jgi:DNA repair protein RecN (Recombination protein N)
MRPDKELNIITGETGAGKSIMLGAVGLLLGNRADTKVLYAPEEKCIIEGNFDVSEYDLRPVFEEEELDYEATCIIRREINPSGKSRAFINDTPVNLDTLRKVGTSLIDVHSQHDTLLLGSNEYQLSILDAYAQNRAVFKGYQAAYRQYRKSEDTYKQLSENAATFRKELDYNSFLLEELLAAKLEAGEQERLEEELNLLENAEDVKLKLNAAVDALANSEYAVNSNLRTVIAQVNTISNLSERYAALRERLESCWIELKDIASEIESEEADVDLDPERIDVINERLSAIYKLQQKHSVKNVDELLEIQRDLDDKVSRVLNLDEVIAEAKAKVDASRQEMMRRAEELSGTRRAVMPAIESELKGLLAEVGMPNASVKISHNTGKPINTGIDEIKFLFTANKGIAPQDLKSVASGGEFSRLMFCVKYILADKTSLPTIIFDEIDTGISGSIALKLGKMMEDMGHRHQVITITHSHQIAARGNAHYFVYKDTSAAKTISRMKRLTDQGRVFEVARMIGGEPPSEAAIKNAKEFLEY